MVLDYRNQRLWLLLYLHIHVCLVRPVVLAVGLDMSLEWSRNRSVVVWWPSFRVRYQVVESLGFVHFLEPQLQRAHRFVCWCGWCTTETWAMTPWTKAVGTSRSYFNWKLGMLPFRLHLWIISSWLILPSLLLHKLRVIRQGLTFAILGLLPPIILLKWFNVTYIGMIVWISSGRKVAYSILIVIATREISTCSYSLWSIIQLSSLRLPIIALRGLSAR